MLVYVEKKISSIDYSNLTVFHYAMFHGISRRPNASYPQLTYTVDDDLEFPLAVSKNVFEIAEIFQPGINLVISEKVKRQLASADNIAFLKIKFEKLFKHPYKKGDLNCPNSRNAEKAMSKFKNDNKLSSQLGNYYELILPLYEKIKPIKRRRSKITIPGESNFSITVTSDLIENYPIFWKKGVFFREDIFAHIEEYLDFDYFQCFHLGS